MIIVQIIVWILTIAFIIMMTGACLSMIIMAGMSFYALIRDIIGKPIKDDNPCNVGFNPLYRNTFTTIIKKKKHSETKKTNLAFKDKLNHYCSDKIEGTIHLS